MFVEIVVAGVILLGAAGRPLQLFSCSHASLKSENHFTLHASHIQRLCNTLVLVLAPIVVVFAVVVVGGETVVVIAFEGASWVIVLPTVMLLGTLFSTGVSTDTFFQGLPSCN